MAPLQKTSDMKLLEIDNPTVKDWALKHPEVWKHESFFDAQGNRLPIMRVSAKHLQANNIPVNSPEHKAINDFIYKEYKVHKARHDRSTPEGKARYDAAAKKYYDSIKEA